MSVGEAEGKGNKSIFVSEAETLPLIWYLIGVIYNNRLDQLKTVEEDSPSSSQELRKGNKSIFTL